MYTLSLETKGQDEAEIINMKDTWYDGICITMVTYIEIWM